MDQIDLDTLEDETADLIATCRKLRQQNQQLQQERDQLQWDRQHCAIKIKALLERLQALEKSL